jgi:glycosyltransferase involved in cell wall biosynthesis
MGGGAQAALVGLLRSLRGVEVHLVVLFGGSTGIDQLRTVVARVHELGSSKTPFGVLMAAFKLRRYLRRADVVYSLMRASHVVIGVLGSAAIPSRASFVASFHQLPSADSRGAFGRVENLLVRRAMRRAVLVTAPSHRAIDELISGGFVDGSRARYAPNPLASRAVDPVAPREGRLSAVRLVFAGRLTAQKGLDQIPTLLRDVDIAVDLRIVGDGPERERLERIMHTVQFPHRVSFVGFSDDVASHLDWSDAILMPSRTELNPVTLWEARLAGRPAITSSIPAFEDLADDGGILLLSERLSMSDAIRTVADDHAWRETCFFHLSALARRAASPDGQDGLRTALMGRATS